VTYDRVRVLLARPLLRRGERGVLEALERISAAAWEERG
jgi:hypothetical protein